MTNGPIKPEKDDEAKASSTSGQSTRPESFFDRAARSFHEFQGDTTNRIVGLIAHQDLAQQFSNSINSQLARQYLEGKSLVEARLAQGKVASDMAGLNAEQLTAVRAYQKIHTDLPSSIPLVDRDALIRSVERSIESKARTARSENTTIPEPHPRAAELHAVRDRATATTQIKSPERTIPKPNEPEARELKSAKSETLPASPRTVPSPHPVREDSPQGQSSSLNRSSAPDKSGSIENNAPSNKYVPVDKSPANPEAVHAQPAEAPLAGPLLVYGAVARAIFFSPLMRNKTLAPDWIQPRFETFSLTSRQSATAVDRLLLKPLPYCAPQFLPQRHSDAASRSGGGERWSQIATRLSLSPSLKIADSGIAKALPLKILSRIVQWCSNECTSLS